MKWEKQFILKWLIILFVILLTIIAVAISSKLIFNHLQTEPKLMHDYENKKQKCELLKNIANSSVHEGVGIDTQKIPNDKIQFLTIN